MAEIPPPGVVPVVDGFIPVGTFDGPIHFNNPFPHDQNVHHSPPRRQSSPGPFRRYDDDAGLGPRISTLDIQDEPRERIRKRGGSNARRQSILVRPRKPSSTTTFSNSYQLYRLEKTGEDWSVADTFYLPAQDKEIS